MPQVTIFDQQKKEVGSLDLTPDVYEVPVRAEILNLVVRALRAEKRSGNHATLTRSMMKGGGAKPWRQKGTGRARAGSNISPIWTGGAVVFGPQPRDYSFKINKKVARLALRMAVSSRLASSNLMVVRDVTFSEVKTKNFVSVQKALGLGKTLVVAPSGDAAREFKLSARNVPGVTVLTPDTLNVYDILKHTHLVLFESTVEHVTERLSA